LLTAALPNWKGDADDETANFRKGSYSNVTHCLTRACLNCLSLVCEELISQNKMPQCRES
jgi:hypothetical protein